MNTSPIKRNIESKIRFFEKIVGLSFIIITPLFFPNYLYPSYFFLSIYLFYCCYFLLSFLLPLFYGKTATEIKIDLNYIQIPLEVNLRNLLLVCSIVFGLFGSFSIKEKLSKYNVIVKLENTEKCVTNGLKNNLEIFINDRLYKIDKSTINYNSIPPTLNLNLFNIYRGTEGLKLGIEIKKKWDCFYSSSTEFNINYFDFFNRKIKLILLKDEKNSKKYCDRIFKEFIDNYKEKCSQISQYTPDHKIIELKKEGEKIIKELTLSSKHCGNKKIINEIINSIWNPLVIKFDQFLAS